MGLLSFVQNVGDKLFGGSAQKEVTPATPGKPTNQEVANALLARIQALHLPITGLKVIFGSGKATIEGAVATQEEKEKIILALGNVDMVDQVDDNLTVTTPAPEAKFVTVKSGDTLSHIAKEQYGNANAYMKIFEANKPMLSHPDKIYPGQMLRIPV